MLNREAPANGWIIRAEDWIWENGSLEALRMLTVSGLRISVATNQSGVGRGQMTDTDVDSVNQRMIQDAAAVGARVDEVAVCRHGPQDNCNCRKPAPGLVLALVQSSGVPASDTLLIGDAVRDLEAARRAGVRASLVRTGKGLASEDLATMSGVPVYDDLLAATRAILDGTLEKDLYGV